MTPHQAMQTADTPSPFTPDFQRLLDQGHPAHQIMAMLQQNGQLAKLPQNQPTVFSTASPSSPAGSSQDTSSFFNSLDASSSAAKQLAALNAAGIARRASQSGGTSGSFIGGIPLNQHNAFRSTSSIGHDPSSPNHHTPPQQLNIPPSTQMPPPSDPSFFQRQAIMPSQVHINSQAAKARQQSFLHGLATIMSVHKRPLPPSITGVASNYDPTTSPWKNLEPASDIGGFKLAGKDVDLFKLWGLVFQAGGGTKLQQQNSWGNVLPHFNLPERLPHPQPNGNTLTANALASYYMALLAPFEEAYIHNIDQQRKAVQARQQQTGGLQQGRPLQNGASSLQHTGFPGQSFALNGVPPNSLHSPQQFPVAGLTSVAQHPPQTGHQTPQRSNVNMMNLLPQGQGRQAILSPTLGGTADQQFTNQMPANSEPIGQSFAANESDLELDGDGRKRKLKEIEEADGKRSRRKTDSEPPHTPSRGPGSERMSQPPASSTPSGPTTSSRPKPSRRKIEYVPLAREVDTFGGRDLHSIEVEIARATHGRPLREIDDWGTVDIEALTMSIRSRIPVELSYSLTTLTLLSSMRGNGPNTGFPIFQCPDLMDEVLDLLEEVAFDGVEDVDITGIADSARITTNRELVNFVCEEGSRLFSGLRQRQGMSKLDMGPRQRPGDIIRLIFNCIRNLSVVFDNQSYMAHHPLLLGLTLRVASLAPPSPDAPRAASLALSLSDLIVIRKDTLNILGNLAGVTSLTTSSLPSKAEIRRTQRVFELIASYLVDPNEALTPIAWLLQSGVSLNANVRPPSLPDAALEVFTRIGQPDANRKAFARAIPTESMWCLFDALVHRLPVVDHDYQVAMRDAWLSYVEKTVMSIYSLAFLMPPDLKKRVKNDHGLGFAKVMLRLVKKLILHPHSEYRAYFSICARRAIEAMKVVDDQDDSFDTSQPNMPQLSFGMGYGEAGDKRVEKGMGLLGAHQDDVTWGIMMQREVDNMMFTELESLTRVDFD